MSINVSFALPSPLPQLKLKLNETDTLAILFEKIRLPPQAIILYHKGNALLKENKTIKEYNIQNEDTITINWRHGYAHLAEQLLQRQNQPQLSDEQRQEQKRQQELNQLLQGLDPDSVEYQTKLAEAIRKENIDSQWADAMEHSPELYGSVTMLYVMLNINNKPVKAFVDSGAQITLISVSYAETLGITRLIDERWKGQFRGVGTANQVGIIHAINISFGSVHLTCQLRVIEDAKEGKGMDFLFGLDMLKRHQACIDLEKNVLRIHGAELPFLSEAEIPKEIVPESKLGNDSIATSSSKAEGAAAPTTHVPDQTQAISEESIKTLQEMAGITREQAREMLTASNGSVELALNLLMG